MLIKKIRVENHKLSKELKKMKVEKERDKITNKAEKKETKYSAY